MNLLIPENPSTGIAYSCCRSRADSGLWLNYLETLCYGNAGERVMLPWDMVLELQTVVLGGVC